MANIFSWNVLTRKQWIWSFIRTAWLVAAVLLVVAGFSYNTSNNSMNNTVTMLSKSMAPTMAYYDAN
jgi:hypothetical protein